MPPSALECFLVSAVRPGRHLPFEGHGEEVPTRIQIVAARNNASHVRERRFEVEGFASGLKTWRTCCSASLAFPVMAQSGYACVVI